MGSTVLNIFSFCILIISMGAGAYLFKLAGELDKGVIPGRPVQPPPHLTPLPSGNNNRPPSPPGPPGPPSPPGPPTPPPAGQTPGYDPTIKGLFRSKDQQAMLFKLDLWSFADCVKNAQSIYQEVSSGSMPCDGAWSADKVALFKSWMDGGMPQTATGGGGGPPTPPPPPANAPVFDPTIKGMFRPQDVADIKKFGVDLTDYTDVKAKAGLILNAVASGMVPKDAPWSSDKVATFKAWMDAGYPEKK